MTSPASAIRVQVDITNPGQFFACCGLLELADRLWPGAEGWFENRAFRIACSGAPGDLLRAIVDAKLKQLDVDDDMASPMRISEPFGITLDWWTDDVSGGRLLKVWAGSMRCVRIARAMQEAIRKIPEPKDLFQYAAVVYEPDQHRKKVEPFYFDSRRSWNAQSIDIGFAPNSLKLTTKAYPAVEFLCLVGLQRCRPRPTKTRRVFEYDVWTSPMATNTVAVATCGALKTSERAVYRFENAFRTDQRKHKSFLPATHVGAST